MLISVRDTGKYDRGVFAEKEIQSNDLIEASPVIIIEKKECKYIKKTILSNYFFIWGEDYSKAAIALGYGSLINHSYQPNVRFEVNSKNRTIDFYAIQTIAPGDEITINYNGDPDDVAPLWFDPIT
ncbi:SET domain-containing protein-lysine N-methyltransferase [Sporosarcina sp. P13]|uniref:SET domain-containing protein n=1 Tax=Sporosarcina sp. P13 TaxID=2048263 RepID=UPI000C16847C|nr:SET domain-containing protein [Sporosarcina sp. P13]PIC63569.1 SET domain-containing protein-lysine N-methyltransferase [Sporosarcina sp. P13]